MKKEVIPTIFFSMLLPLSVIQYGQIFNNKIFFVEFFLLLSSVIYIFFFKFPRKLLLVFFLYIPTFFFCFFNPIFSQIYEMVYIFVLYFVFLIITISYGYQLTYNSYLKVINFFGIFCLVVHLTGYIFPNNNGLPGFSGIFGNPNMYGIFSSTVFTFLCLSLFEFKHKPNFFMFFSLIFSFLGVFLSVSRSSLFICLFLITLYLFFLKVNFSKISLKKAMLGIFTLCLGILISIKLSFFQKFLEKNNALDGDLSNGRVELWSYGFSIMNFTGLGREYYNPFEVGFHNNFINLGVIFGKNILLSNLIFWFGLLFFLIYKCFFMKQSRFIIPIIMLLLTLLFWSIEVGSSFVFVWIFCLVFGYALNDENAKVVIK